METLEKVTPAAEEDNFGERRKPVSRLGIEGGKMSALGGVKADMTITMYGADWCGDCRRAKAWFESHDIEYRYVDLVDIPDETARVLEPNNGVKKIPIIVFGDDSHLIEPTNDELAAKMAELKVAPDVAVEERVPAVIENAHLGRFELLRNSEVVSFANYTERNVSIVVSHVETAPEHRGNGYAAELMEGLLAIIRSDGRTITPLCPFAASHIRDNEQHHDLLI